MKVYATEDIRNVALVSHSGAGKTTLVERLLFASGATQRMGRVQDGNAAMDFEEEEMARNSSISTAIAPIEYSNLKVNLLDTPGYTDFIGEVNSALSVAEGAIVVVEALSGVEVGTEIAYQITDQKGIPRVLLVNKMDRDNVRVARTMTSISENLDGNFIRLQLPIGEGATFKGVVDLISMEARLGENDERGPIPGDLQDEAEEARAAMIEAAAEGDDELMEKYFADEPFTEGDVIRGLRGAITQGLCVPVLFSAPEPGIAVKPLLGALTKLLPAPNETLSGAPREFTLSNEDGEEQSTHLVSADSPLTAFCFKTRDDQYGKLSYLKILGGTLESDTRVWDAAAGEEVRVGTLQILNGGNQTAIGKLVAGDIGGVVKLGDVNTNSTLVASRSDAGHLPKIEQPNTIVQTAITAVSQSDLGKMSAALNRLTAEDTTLTWHNELATKETILSGMGQTHLDIAVKKAKSKFGVSLSTATPKIPYRETITRTASAEHTHKKQSGGAGQYARVMLRVESLDDDAQFEFTSEIFGGAISAPFVAATEKGCRAALEGGVIAGYPVTGVKAVVYDGKEHPVDSKEIAFQTAGRECFKKAVNGANPTLLEPIYLATVTVLSEQMGDIMGDFNTRRARVLGMDQAGNKAIVKAEVPLGEMQTYQQDLRSMTGGRGTYAMTFLRYGRVPSHVQQKIVEAFKAEQAA